MHTFSIIYIFFAFYLLVILLYRGYGLKQGKVENIFMLISFLILTIFHVGVNVESVEDLPLYESAFNRIAAASGSDIFNQYRSQEYLFIIANKVVAFISKDFVFFLLIYNLFFFLSHYLIIREYSPYVPISIVVLLIYNYNQSLFVLRQYMAISILLFTIPCIIKGKIIPYLVLCVMAFFTHYSSIIWLPIYFMYGIKKKRVFILSAVAFTLFFILMRSDLGKLMIFVFNMDAYDAYMVENKIDIKQIIIPSLYLVFYVFSLKKHIFDLGMNKICFIALLIIVIGYAFAPGMNQVGRMLQYFQTLSIISIPITVSYIKSKPLRFVYLFSVITLNGYLTNKGLYEFYFIHYKFGGFNMTYYIIIFLVGIWLMRKSQLA
ncbi:EpsG-like putative glucosyltransferase [Bacteroides heparinolyticus]|uniref:EpsG-like putative glucosyltransferase n=1 Tax=Prevotella heparinolytica TaxID=28113 RepID=A0A4R2LTC8_9BACE|nr:EpsG-like putative glucosyltransferase [Bacteroides heparinolyticus]